MSPEQSNTPQETLAQSLTSESVSALPLSAELFNAHTDREKKVLETLQSGVENILTSEGMRDYLRMVSKFHHYSWVNTLLIAAQRPDATLVNSYDRWQQLGRQVQKGETGIKIFYPMFGKRVIEDPDTGEETMERYIKGFGIGNTFDISQTEGEALPETPAVTENTGTSDIATAVNLKLSRFLIDEGIQMESKEIKGHARGYWNPTHKQIVIGSSLFVEPTSISKTRTLIHEASHYLADHKSGISREDAETVAEGATFVTMEHFGLEAGETSFAYIAQWAKDLNVLKTNMGDIQKTSHGLIQAIEGVTDPYADEFGSFDRADPWAAVREQIRALEEAEDDAHYL